MTQEPGAAAILRYWHDTAGLLEPDPAVGGDQERIPATRGAYEKFDTVDEDSALASYLRGDLGETAWVPHPVILPFRSNQEQRCAVEKALRNRLSVIKGPPGTGKTETILNVIANIALDPDKSVGVVSFGNSAVENVRDKLADEGLGFIAAELGKNTKVEAFIAGQEKRNLDLEDWCRQQLTTHHQGQSPREAEESENLVLDDVAASEQSLIAVWKHSRELAVIRQEIAAFELEKEHFDRSVEDEQLPQLDAYPLIQKSSERIVDFLVDRTVEPGRPQGVSGLVKRVRDYFTYGRLKDLDPEDSRVILRLHQAFYDQRLRELRARAADLESKLAGLDEATVRRRHQDLSRRALDDALVTRYTNHRRTEFSDQNHITRRISQLVQEYPVLLSTCHSIRRNVGNSDLLDWIIIDEASQVDLLVAALAMSKARNVVIVGDLKQLGHIADKTVQRQPIEPPDARYDVVAHNILSSVMDVYGESIPQTQLREHFRCPPAIIGFCNRMFYDGELVPVDTRPEGQKNTADMSVVVLAPGNHARRITHGNLKGTFNQREIEVITDEVVTKAHDMLDKAMAGAPLKSPGAGASDVSIGVATPYKLQAKRLSAHLNASGQIARRDAADTIHRYQGRGLDTMVLSTVIDESQVGRMGAKFVDDPRMLNVAVSRAKKKFIMVVHHNKLTKTKYLSALVDYIRYQDPQQVVESEIVSIFDLLYAEYSQRLNDFAARIEKVTPYDSENSALTAIRDLLEEETFRNLKVVSQIRLKDLLPSVSRLNDLQRKFVRSVASVDFGIYHGVSNRLVLAVEVDGFSFHENCPEQLARDRVKNSILDAYDIPLLRLKTTGSGEHQRIRDKLNHELGLLTDSQR